MLWLWMESQYLFEWLATSVSGITCAALALCITAYQRYLSPRKGFCCAHRVLHQQHSCSEFTKSAIMRRGFLPALPLIRRRFADCRSAGQLLHASEERQTKERKQQTGRPQNDANPISRDACYCMEQSLESGACFRVPEVVGCDAAVIEACPCGCSFL